MNSTTEGATTTDIRAALLSRHEADINAAVEEWKRLEELRVNGIRIQQRTIIADLKANIPNLRNRDLARLLGWSDEKASREIKAALSDNVVRLAEVATR